MKFQDKIVFVTGSSRNTGLGIAEAFLQEGATVYLNGSTKESTAYGAEMLRQKGFSSFFELPGDVGNRQVVSELFDEIKEKTGRLDIMVNNAVVQACGYSFEETPPEVFEDAIRTNLLGTVWCSQFAANMMIAQKSGVIVNLSSNVSTRAIHKRAAYCSSKGGIDGLTRAMAIDLAPFGIRVNSVAPGYIRTERWETLKNGDAERRRRNVPLGREALAKDIADVVMFLASDASRYMTGERLVVDGGTTAQHLPVDIDI